MVGLLVSEDLGHSDYHIFNYGLAADTEFTSNATGLHTCLNGVRFGSSGTAIAQSTVYSPRITPNAVSAASCADQIFTVTGLVTTDELTALNPPSALGNVSNQTGRTLRALRSSRSSSKAQCR